MKAHCLLVDFLHQVSLSTGLGGSGTPALFLGILVGPGLCTDADLRVAGPAPLWVSEGSCQEVFLPGDQMVPLPTKLLDQPKTRNL